MRLPWRRVAYLDILSRSAAVSCSFVKGE